MVDWNSLKDFERYPKLAEEMQNIGDFSVVKFLDDGNDVSADKLQKVLIEKGQKNIKARDSIVFHVQKEGADYEIWLSATSYTNLRELKKIRDNNKETLVGAMVKYERVSKDDMGATAFKFGKA